MDSTVFDESEGDVLRLRRIVTELPADEMECVEDSADDDDSNSKSKVSRLFSSTKDLTSSEFPSAKRMVSAVQKLARLHVLTLSFSSFSLKKVSKLLRDSVQMSRHRLGPWRCRQERSAEK